MASQVSHIVYAKKYFDRLDKIGSDENNIPPKKLDRDEFLLGCVFPDIRRIDSNITRKETHLKFDPVDLNFSKLSSFEAGWKFHLYCDMKREEILNAHKFYEIAGAGDFYGQAAKSLEDELVYDEYNNWEKIRHYFNNPPRIENGINVEIETFNLWYAILSKYFEKKPDEKSLRIFFTKQPHHQSNINELMESTFSLGKNKKAVEILEKVSEEIV
ncbi:MAG: hypothetical protein A2288_01650 [Candidatus Moranbacteria bacterium RIFOXYA12_FULL_44_15]|nr:MAG: hypothetical protein A2288_01650 [Candidatus Moranbacteria bacterium RIFOXYA12_FULL_44_15]OGI34274.1 MAG: hypothetical protein A2259_04400 [Candidatus Moranbacteria bacterium RIFOXYA2_FULL_43_15]